MEILKEHNSKETAYIVNDYPYGFRLRCKIRYWLEYKKGKGVRFCSQTTNPKIMGEKWNKEKCSTYQSIAGCMYLNDVGHVVWSGLNEYSSYKEAEEWSKKFREGVFEDALKNLDNWILLKEKYESKLSTGMDYRQAGMETVMEGHGLKD